MTFTWRSDTDPQVTETKAATGPDVSVIVPFYNEEESLPGLLQALYARLGETGRSFEVILVDDGSLDGSLETAGELVEKYPDAMLVSLRRNRGKSAALAVGIEHASGAVIVTVDADLQDDPADVPKFLEKLDDGLDLVSGWRRPRRDSLYKRFQSRLYNFALKLAGFRVVHDINCGFKAMRAEVAREIPLYGERHRLIPLIASWQGFRVGEVVVNHRPRMRGKSKYGASRFPNAIFDIFTALLLSRFYRRPSHLFSSVGSILALAGLVICGYITYLKVSTGTIQYRYPLLILGVVLLAVGVQLVLTGFLSELIVHTRSRPSPEYSIKKLVKSPEKAEHPSAGK